MCVHEALKVTPSILYTNPGQASPKNPNEIPCQNPPCNLVIKAEISRFFRIPNRQQVLDARRRGATTEAYGGIRRKEERSKATPQMMPDGGSGAWFDN
jgi:hypothetical protein